MKLKSYAQGHWQEGQGSGQILKNAVTGEVVAEVGSQGIDFKGMVEYARKVGGTNLRKYTIHERAYMLRDLAKYLLSKKDLFYDMSYATGATKVDSWIDIEGGIGTLFTYSGKARREMPNEKFYVDGKMEHLSREGSFQGHHICVPKEGVALHINAFNFPCWGMLEKLSPSIVAGMPCIVKPASLTSYLTELMVREIIASGILPEGAVQLIAGSAGDIFEHLDMQDVVTFTGSHSTGVKLKSHPNIINNSIPFNMEADSLNFSMLGLDAKPGTAEFDLFIKEVTREMTTKAGQKCTAIRRTIVPEQYTDDVIKALSERLAKTTIGDPRQEGVRMGPLAGTDQVKDVRSALKDLLSATSIVYGDMDNFDIVSGNKAEGAFFPAMLLYCDDPLNKLAPHNVEAFGPISTVMPFKNTEDAIELAKLGRGSLVGSVFTADNDFARTIAYGTAAYHGRLMFINEHSAKESTGHGSPMPQLVHGGPGRAGGGEELGGVRSILHYMQRTAIQGHPDTLTAITQEYQKGSTRYEDVLHPFRKHFEELKVGDSLTTHKRTVTETDIVNFANISGDNFYAHTDITSLGEGSIFTGRVAHGYFVMSAAAGLFVDPKKGPVLANYGLDDLRFIQPVYVNDTIYVKLTVKSKQDKQAKEGEIPSGVVKWDVEVLNQNEEQVAQATILTLVTKL
jgi:oxepin-CoA hydrolase/3-oxo-5,6-dehydrosuberyl-CoA semialdehyde dehydrogenase